MVRWCSEVVSKWVGGGAKVIRKLCGAEWRARGEEVKRGVEVRR